MPDYARKASAFEHNRGACCRGTHIKIDGGETVIELLKAGERLASEHGSYCIVTSVELRGNCSGFGRYQDELGDILIRRGAIEDNVPKRDLRLSALTELVLNGIEIPLYSLVNQKTIIPILDSSRPDLFFLEADGPGIVNCDGTLVVCRAGRNDPDQDSYVNEFGDECPYAVAVKVSSISHYIGYWAQLDKARRSLADRAIFLEAIEAAAVIQVRSHLDFIDSFHISGWAWQKACPSNDAWIKIYDNGIELGQVLANEYRADLEAREIGDGAHAFVFYFPKSLSRTDMHVISAKWASTGVDLEGSPFTLQAMSEPSVASGDLEQRPLLTDNPADLDSDPPTNLTTDDVTRHGRLEKATRQTIVGWAWDSSEPHEPSLLRLYLDDGEYVCKILANHLRRDLEHAGIGDGRHGFEVSMLHMLSSTSAHFVHVCFDSDGVELENSPIYVSAPSTFDDGLKEILNVAVSAVEDDRIESTVSVLADHVTELLGRLGASHSQRYQRQAYMHFRRRWGRGVNEYAASKGSLAIGCEDPGRRALVVDDEVPSSDRDAGSQAILSHMRALQKLGYSVSFIAAQQLADRHADVSQLETANISCLRTPYYASVEEVLRQQPYCFDLVYLHRLSNVSKYLSLVRQYCPSAVLIYSVADLHHLRVARQAAVEDRPELIVESNRLRLAECTAAWQADAVLTHSNHEADVLRKSVPDAKVTIVPWGYEAAPVNIPFLSRNGVAFVGNFSHSPNVDAAYFLVEDIMPLVWEEHPEIECILAGSGMTAGVRELGNDRRIVVMGHVARLSDVFERARITVAPLRYGAGVKGKVLSSVAAGVPCVMSQVAAEGVDWPHPLRSFIGDSAQDLARKIGLLYTNSQLADDIATAGLFMIREDFSQSSVEDALRSAIEIARRK
jgi:glycosyltransferase involved in cell wall biosynthesis